MTKMAEILRTYVYSPYKGVPPPGVLTLTEATEISADEPEVM